MPILKRRCDHIRVYRPDGTRYAQSEKLPTWEDAVYGAIWAFEQEFGTKYQQRDIVIDIIGSKDGWVATMSEVKESK